MSVAAVPENEGEKMAYEARSDGSTCYEGYMENNLVCFYFHCEKGVFLCETEVEGKAAKMAGDLKLTDNGEWSCKPVWGIQPDDDDESLWVDTKGEEEKFFDLKLDKIMFEGVELVKK